VDIHFIHFYNYLEIKKDALYMETMTNTLFDIKCQEMDKKVDFSCNICNKFYASYKSLWNHCNKFHKPVCLKESENVKENVKNVKENVKNVKENVKKSLTCDFCYKIFNNRPAKCIHKKTCKSNHTQINEVETLKNTVNELKNQVALLVKENGKIHPKTLQRINNQLNNVNNGNVINNTYVKFGDVEYEKILNNKQIKQILDKQYQSLEESIKQIHFNKNLPEYSNIFITNMKDDLAYVFDGKQFISVRKNEILNELIDIHTKEINFSLDKNKCDMNQKYVGRLEKFLDMLNDDDTKFTDKETKRTYPSYKAYKINSIKLMIYNNSDKFNLSKKLTQTAEE
jgi:hypothetical protein